MKLPRTRVGKPVRVAGAIPSGEYRFPFPELALEASLVFRRSSDPIELHCDTVWIDLDAGELCITWSGHQRIQGRAHDVLGARLRGDVRRVAA